MDTRDRHLNPHRDSETSAETAQSHRQEDAETQRQTQGPWTYIQATRLEPTQPGHPETAGHPTDPVGPVPRPRSPPNSQPGKRTGSMVGRADFGEIPRPLSCPEERALVTQQSRGSGRPGRREALRREAGHRRPGPRPSLTERKASPARWMRVASGHWGSEGKPSGPGGAVVTVGTRELFTPRRAAGGQ